MDRLLLDHVDFGICTHYLRISVVHAFSTRYWLLRIHGLLFAFHALF